MKRIQFFALAALALGIAGPATLSARDLRDVRHDDARVYSTRDRCERNQRAAQWQRSDVRRDVRDYR
ncbi:MAG TPA: hypothetical protein VG456_04530 [Candidatus Sulfopaludibacter sp.]|jgi:hypothetical protein|nr:hypothetical protein [Candidatus Sulfopaludibacter sp.]